MTEPGSLLPRVQEVYWVDGGILPFDGAGGQAVIVVDVPTTPSGTIGVAFRDGAGGRFPVLACLWTPANVVPA